MNRWFTADPHFGHANIIKHCNRPFSSVEEMNREMIERWNAVVDDDDEVWVLGDVCMNTSNLAYVEDLNGIKYLQPGNHDKCHVMHCKTPAKWERACFPYEEVGFVVMPSRSPRKTSIGGQHVLMSHFPYIGNTYDRPQYDEFRPKNEGAWLLHGHIHDLWKVQDRMINVGVDVWDFTPVHEDQIAAIING